MPGSNFLLKSRFCKESKYIYNFKEYGYIVFFLRGEYNNLECKFSLLPEGAYLVFATDLYIDIIIY